MSSAPGETSGIDRFGRKQGGGFVWEIPIELDDDSLTGPTLRFG